MEQKQTRTMEEPPLSLTPGSVRFYNNSIPPLQSGSYQITVAQEIVDPSGKFTSELPSKPFTQNQAFDVLGPRFRLDPLDVFSVHPPGSSVGEFGELLPQIVLTRRTLPWERRLGSNTPDSMTEVVMPEERHPWLALVLLDESEILDGGDPESNPTLGRTVEVQQAVNLPPDGKILTAQVTLSSFEDPRMKCRVIDLPPAVFTDVLPKAAELPLLAHCRQVETEHKEILDLDDEGLFAIVVGNRFPNTEGRNIVHLVSLESFKDYLPDGSKSPAGYERVRLVSLASWFFTATRARGSFASLMKNLDSGLLMMPVSEETRRAAQTPAQKLVLKAIDGGYVPIKYGMRQGEKTTAWYRGPLLPVPTEQVQRPDPFVTADSAMIYDQKTGLFDLSLATAWQIGRLVALADKTFSVEMLKWRREGRQVLRMVLERKDLYRQFSGVVNFDQVLGSRKTSNMLDPLLIFDLVLEFLGTTVSGLTTREDDALFGALCDPSGLECRLADLPGVVSRDEMAELLAGGGDPIEALRRKVFGDNGKG
jgi:hypothetical protein